MKLYHSQHAAKGLDQRLPADGAERGYCRGVFSVRPSAGWRGRSRMDPSAPNYSGSRPTPLARVAALSALARTSGDVPPCPLVHPLQPVAKVARRDSAMERRDAVKAGSAAKASGARAVPTRNDTMPNGFPDQVHVFALASPRGDAETMCRDLEIVAFDQNPEMNKAA